MQTVTLKIQDHAVDAVMALLEKLPKQDVERVSQPQALNQSIANQPEELNGIFSAFYY